MTNITEPKTVIKYRENYVTQEQGGQVNLVEVAIAKAKSAVKTEEVNTLVTSDELSGHRFSSSTITF